MTTEKEWLEKAEKYILRTRLDKGNVSGPVLVAGEGSVVYDVAGKEYLDFNSGQMCSALGHRAPRVVDAIRNATDKLIHASSSIFNIYEIELAEKLASICPAPLTRSFFMESGADSNEAAIQVARVVTGRTEVASPHTGFHGLSDATRAVTYGVPAWHRGYGPYDGTTHAVMAPYCYRCPIKQSYPECDIACLNGSMEVLDHQLGSPLAAVIAEPLFSAGGVIEPPAGWLRRVKEECEQRGALLILDEAQTGLGKLGSMWGFQRHGVVPDVITVSKHFGGGVSISAVVTTDEIADKVEAAGFVHGHSHSSDPLACMAASATIDTLVTDDLPSRAQELGQQWHSRLEQLATKHAVIGDIRGVGLVQGVELVTDRESRAPAVGLGYELEKHCVDHGLFFSVRREGAVIRFVPPWTTTEAQFDHAQQIFDSALTAVTQDFLASSTTG